MSSCVSSSPRDAILAQRVRERIEDGILKVGDELLLNEASEIRWEKLDSVICCEADMELLRQMGEQVGVAALALSGTLQLRGSTAAPPFRAGSNRFGYLRWGNLPATMRR